MSFFFFLEEDDGEEEERERKKVVGDGWGGTWGAMAVRLEALPANGAIQELGWGGGGAAMVGGGGGGGGVVAGRGRNLQELSVFRGWKSGGDGNDSE